jgi:glycosyltransferase involved in cell wall biosynthesis
VGIEVNVLDQATQEVPVQVAYIGCWYKNDMYSHNCSNLVESLRGTGMQVDVITSNCRCFSTAQQFAIGKDELINEQCSPVCIPHAPANPGKKRGLLKYLAVRALRLDLIFATARGFLYYKRAREADVIHFDQVLEAFGCIPFFVLIILASLFNKRVVVTVHEIDPFQRQHRWLNRLYSKCAAVLVYSENMKQEVVALGASADNIKVMRYGTRIPELVPACREQYIYFGGHNIARGKGYTQLLDALVTLKSKGFRIPLVIYVGYGCNGLEEAKRQAIRKDVADMIQWQDFYSAEELANVYQRSKACIIPFTSGSARHPLTSAMVNATPVIATRAVDIPEYLGDLGIYVDGSASSIHDAISEIEGGRKNMNGLGEKLRARALAELDYTKIAQDLTGEYSRINSDQLIGLDGVTGA